MTYPENADLETPLEDAAEQATSAVPGRPEDDEDLRLDIETPEWDAQEQARTVEIDDEYR